MGHSYPCDLTNLEKKSLAKQRQPQRLEALEKLITAEKNESRRLPKKIQLVPKTIHHQNQEFIIPSETHI